MRVVIQKVLSASVSVNGELVSKIGKGLMCLIGVRDDDEKACSELIAKKILVYLWSREVRVRMLVCGMLLMESPGPRVWRIWTTKFSWSHSSRCTDRWRVGKVICNQSCSQIASWLPSSEFASSYSLICSVHRAREGLLQRLRGVGEEDVQEREDLRWSVWSVHECGACTIVRGVWEVAKRWSLHLDCGYRWLRVGGEGDSGAFGEGRAK